MICFLFSLEIFLTFLLFHTCLSCHYPLSNYVEYSCSIFNTTTIFLPPFSFALKIKTFPTFLWLTLSSTLLFCLKQQHNHCSLNFKSTLLSLSSFCVLLSQRSSKKTLTTIFCRKLFRFSDAHKFKQQNHQYPYLSFRLFVFSIHCCSCCSVISITFLIKKLIFC